VHKLFISNDKLNIKKTNSKKFAISKKNSILKNRGFKFITQIFKDEFTLN